MKCFIDSSAFIAYANKTDQYHKDAADIFNKISDQHSIYHQVFTSFYVIDETITTLLYHSNYKVARDWASKIFSSKVIEIIVEDRELLIDAWNNFKKYYDKKLSYTDCVIVSLSRKYNIDQIFTFDEDFSKIGLDITP
ncbi:MAG: type II toxin-antitoxin system VapC family toxin [Candidatus Hodarchaeales archaeon]